MADWVDLDIDDAYVTLLAAINDRDEDAASMFQSAPTNPFVGMIRYNRSTNKFEEYRTTPAPAWYELNIALAGGGTGANTASGARSALGLDSMAVQAASSVAITGGTIAAATLTGTIATARLGSGVADVTKLLRGDQSWQVIPSGDAIGVSKMYWGPTDPDSNWMIENGRAISRVTYATLFALIGVTHGSGDGSSTFNIPNSEDRMPIGKSGTLALGAIGGSFNHVHSLNNHTHPYTEIVDHVHAVNITDPGHQHDESGFGGGSDIPGGGGSYGETFPLTNGNTTGITATTSNPAGSVASGTTAGNTGDTGSGNPPYLARNFIIKVL